MIFNYHKKKLNKNQANNTLYYSLQLVPVLNRENLSLIKLYSFNIEIKINFNISDNSN